MLAIVLMVKNESGNIVPTLRPLIDGGIRKFFILDTGSEDGTVVEAHQFLKNAGVTFQLIESRFVDFSTSRNQAIGLAEKVFPETTFLLMPDAEWILNNTKELLTFCEQQKKNSTPLYLIKLRMQDTVFYTARLFRLKSQIRFEGVVHEAPTTIATVKVPEHIYFDFISSKKGVKNSQARWSRDLALLMNEFESTSANPNPRTLFYLAQTHQCLQNPKQAYHFYQLRSNLRGWDEELFITKLRLGMIAESLAGFTWGTALDHYHQAYGLRPHRAEPLVQIAGHYWPENIPLCHLYSERACELEYPQNDILFVDNFVYDYIRFELLSRSAWYVQKYSQGLWATRKALEARPQTQHLLNNLKLYEDKISS